MQNVALTAQQTEAIDIINHAVAQYERTFRITIPKESNKNHYTRACWCLACFHKLHKGDEASLAYRLCKVLLKSAIREVKDLK